ncbi:FtsX-like permease family protein [Paenibacillus sacheonensis]|uniref:Peptidase M1 membrane alanine aminopeptidase domain-containing protein n=1 Tax=Paenibacillus sacheonensis TaxID=742054 RepID=A0A7X5BYR9_9BACL|nr:hypothetical protein [Paenibacillus sacheonensis]
MSVFVALVSWALEAGFLFANGSELSLPRFLAMGASGFVIFLLGSIAPIVQVGKIKPMETLRTGEHQSAVRRMLPVRNLVQLAAAHFYGKLKRNLLSVITMTVPTSLLIFFVFVTIRLKGMFYTSWVGQYAAAEIGTLHYIAVGVCLLISMLTTAEIMWQNVSERKPEIALQKALGWRNRAVRQLVLAEGILAGCIAGLLAFVLGIAFISILYQQLPVHEMWYLLPIGVVPVLTGALGSVLPAEMAVAMSPVQGMSGGYSSAKQTEDRLKRSLLVGVSVVAIIAFIAIGRMLAANQEGGPKKAGAASVPIQAAVHEAGPLTDYDPESVADGSEAAYHLQLRMSERGDFTAQAGIDVTNRSTEAWDKLVFYMIPNQFTEKEDEKTYRISARFSIQAVKVDGRNAAFTLEGDTLSIRLAMPLAPKSVAKVQVAYGFTVPEDGIRYTKSEGSYYLSEWYPMLATYAKGWDKRPFTPISESYDTGFADFDLAYQLPQGYRVISSSDEDSADAASAGTLHLKRAKEFTVVVTPDLVPVTKRVDGVDIRVWNTAKNAKQAQEALRDAADAFHYFNAKIGTYPYVQLDLVLGDLMSMEYPGIVTAGISDQTKHTLIHEMAHQWFYGVVSNDPYTDGWLDEGMTELSASLYLNDFSFSERFRRSGSTISNLPLSDFESKDIVAALYAQPVLKFKALFEHYGGLNNGIAFLHAYYQRHAYRQVDTAGFVKFVKAYYGMKDDDFFKGWIELE